MAAFDCLPLAALVDGGVFSVRGGLSPALPLAERANAIARRQEIPGAGPRADLTWSDREEHAGLQWHQNARRGVHFRPRRRRQVQPHKQAPRRDALAPARAGRRCERGRLINVWSAPNYGYSSANIASVLRLRCDGARQDDLLTFRDAQKRLDHVNAPADSAYFA
jgi:diadenosine tetraphosphatase ApaH/serine/threonine PP2A family protein phosphatase